jgi:predicted dehydrogenase
VKTIRVCVVGAGPMGRLHARTVAASAARGDGCALTVVVDRHPGRAEELAAAFGATASDDLERVLSEVDAVVVAVPTQAHFELAERVLQQGLDVLVEKPLAGSVAEGEALVRLARERGCMLQVGHVEWYNRAWREAARLAGPLRRIEVERSSPTGERGLDIDVVQDYMLHDLDWVTRLVAEDVLDLEATGRCVVHESLDEAEVRFRFRSGCRVVLRASRVGSRSTREARFEGREGIFFADLLARRVIGQESTFEDPPDPLACQWGDFLASIRSRKSPESDGATGVAALRIVDRVRDAIEKAARSPERDDDPDLGG